VGHFLHLFLIGIIDIFLLLDVRAAAVVAAAAAAADAAAARTEGAGVAGPSSNHQTQLPSSTRGRFGCPGYPV